MCNHSPCICGTLVVYTRISKIKKSMDVNFQGYVKLIYADNK